MLTTVKLALRLTTDAYNAELQELIDAAVSDLELAGVGAATHTDEPLVRRAIITYCRAFFGEPNDFAQVKAAYDEQKAQMVTSSRFNHHGGF